MDTIEFDGMEEEVHTECSELLELMESSLLQMQEEGSDSDKLNAIFRAVHTIKGAGGMFEIDYLEKFSHLAENVLDAARNDKIEITDHIVEVLLESVDQIQALLTYALETKQRQLDTELEETNVRLMNEFRKMLGEERQEIPSSEAEQDFTEEAEAFGDGPWEVIITPKPESVKQGIEPREFLKFLDFAGSVEAIEINYEKLPALESFDPEICYLSFRASMSGISSKEEVLSALELAGDAWEITVNPPALEKKEEEQVEVTAEEGSKEISSQEGALAEEKQVAPKKQSLKSSTIRVDSNKVDVLINQIGEMVIANANVIQQVTDMKNKELIEAVSIVSRMLEEIRESTMKVRMVQIGETFNRFKRIVHDLAKELGKEVNFITLGGETELDKSVIEKIYDPLIHLIRNGLDHGLETPQQRKEEGKPPKGTLTLKAHYEAGSITIEIVDDGKGINEKVIFSKAVEKGLIKSDTNLSRQQIYNLIFHPGFSTADTISNISGRGVGMDVVKRNIEDLRGSIDVDSELGTGTTLTIRLPLTLAIIDGLLVSVGQTYYVIPLDMISECFEFNNYYKKQMQNQNYINLRGSLLPVLDMRRFFDEPSQHENERDNIVVVHSGGQSIGLLVDELHGEFQTVIKPLGKVFRNLRGISGATILGSGIVALILDIPMLTQYTSMFATLKENKEAS